VSCRYLFLLKAIRGYLDWPAIKTSLKGFILPVMLKKKYLNTSVVSNPSNGLSYIQFNSLITHAGLVHGIFTRKGGLSRTPYDCLNVSCSTGDRPENVNANLDLIKNEIRAARIVSMNQVHGTDIITVHKGACTDLSIRSADAIITDVPMLGIMVKQADCQGIILYDEVKSVIAVVHCGWKGNVQDIPGMVVNRMKLEFGCEPRDILAAIGPSLGPCCAEFTSYREIFPHEFISHMVSDNHFDLWEISRRQLIRAGLMDDNVETAGICTKCNTDLFYSYRAEGETGRFGTVAMLKE
jgi:YfiH family protein